MVSKNTTLVDYFHSRFYCHLPNIRDRLCARLYAELKDEAVILLVKPVKKGTKTKTIQLNQLCLMILNENLFQVDLLVSWSPLSLLCPLSGRAAHDCMQAIINSTKVGAVPIPLHKGGAHALSLRFSLDDFLTVPFLLSSFNTFSLWSSTFIMVSLASVTWSITSLQRCILP